MTVAASRGSRRHRAIGLIRHVHLLVADHGRAVAFSREAFGMEERFRDGPIVFLTTPGGGDPLALHLASSDDERARVGSRAAGSTSASTPPDRSIEGVGEAVERIERAGGSLIERGRHPSGSPYAYVTDPDGYVIEI